MKKITKKLIPILLAVAVIFGVAFFAMQSETLFPKAEAATSGTCGDNVTWTLDETTGVLTISGTGKMKDYSSKYAPWYNSSSAVKSVVIENGVTSIGNCAFYECTSLTSITIPDSVTSIGTSAFYDCTGLTTVTFGENSQLTSIGGSAFSGCTSLTSITIPDSVTSIGTSAFYDCTGLTTVTFGENSQLTSIGYYAFSRCTGLTTVTFGENSQLTSIGGSAFSGCTSLTTVTFGENSQLTSIGTSAFYDCTGLTSIDIPTGVTNIDQGAFSGCSGLTSITIPNGVTTIGDSAFRDCTGLASVTIPDRVTSISDGAFLGCTGLTSVTIPDSVTSVGGYAFYECTSLTSITIPDRVTSIGDSAFSGCTSLTSITIPDRVTSIGDSAFSGCTGLKEFTMPASAKIYNSEYTFYGCTNIEKVTITKGTGVMQDYGISSSSSSTTTYYLYTPWYISRNNIKKIIIEDGVTNIGDEAFSNCTGLTNITIPDSVTSIGIGAFRYCKGLSSVKIPDSVTSIGDYAFSNCTGLTNITIPDSVTSIGYYAFSDCTGLKELTMPVSVNLVENSYNELSTTDIFQNCANIEKIIFTFGTGEMPHDITLAESKSIREVIIEDGITARVEFENCGNLEKVKIGEGITNIGYNTFMNCISLESVSIPESVTHIWDGAFYNCDSLKTIKLPDSLTYIGGAFRGCTGLTSITIPEGITALGGTFSDCINLTSVTIPDSVTNIGHSAFKGCTSLTSITIPNGVTSIGHSAFSGCTSLTSITIPNGVTSIGDEAFYNCIGLTSITIPDSVTSIGDDAFLTCTGLTSITIGNGVTSIGDYAFSGGCQTLQHLIIPDSVKSIGEYAFSSFVGIKELTIPASAEYPQSAFSYSKSIEKVTLTKGSGIMASGVVSNLRSRNIKEIIIEDGVINIITYAFYTCTELEKITIGKDVATVGHSAFNNCSNLKETNFTGTLAQWCNIEFLGNSQYPAYCANPVYYSRNLYLNDELVTNLSISVGATEIKPYVLYNCESLTSVTIPDSVTSIGEYAFSNCTGLEKIKIGDGVTGISEGAFSNCTSLNSISIGSGLTSIGKKAFLGCTSLKGINITYGVTDIAEEAFSGCSGLSKVTIPETIATIGINAFADCTALKELSVPVSTGFAKGSFNNCTNIEKVTLTKGTKTMVHYDTTTYRYTPWYISRENIKEITIADGVKNIGSYAFYDCIGLTSITIPESVTIIEEYGFYQCSGLKAITIPANITNIGEYAFYGCTGLTKTNYTGTVDKWCVIVFDNASANPVSESNNFYLNNELVTDLILPDSVSRVYPYAFYGCHSLASLTTNRAYSIGDYSFAYCSNLKNVEFSERLSSFGKGVFYMCKSFAHIELPDTITSFGDGTVFMGTGYYNNSDNWENGMLYIGTYLVNSNPSLVAGNCAIKHGTKMIANAALDDCIIQSILIPESVIRIDNAAFTNCPYLDYIHIPASVIYIGSKITNNTNKVVICCDVSGSKAESYAGISYKSYYTFELCAGHLCPHILGDWIIESEATENTEGKRVRKCTICFETVNEEPVRLVTDNASGVSMQIGANSVFGEIKVNAAPVANSTANSVLEQNVDTAKSEIHSITMTVDGAEVQPDDTVFIKIPVPESYDVENSSVYYVDPDNGTVEKVEATYSNGFFTVQTDKLGNFAVVEEIKAYNVTWIIDGVETVVSYKQGEAIVKPADPTKEGYIFKGWSSDVPSEMPDGDLIFTAVWKEIVYYNCPYCEEKFTGEAERDSHKSVCDSKPIEPEKTYTITFIIDGKQTVISYKQGEAIAKPADPTKDGYTFKGWTPDIPATMPAYDMTFTAVFEKNNDVTPPSTTDFKMVIRNPSTTTINYGDSIILHADVEGTLPEGAKIIWDTPSNGHFSYSVSADGKTCTITPVSSGDTEFAVKVVDENGNDLCEPDTQKMTSNAGFFQKIIAFFKKLFGLTKVIPQAFKAIS